MSRPHRDSRGYYRALGVSPQASNDEIHLAYQMLRQTASFAPSDAAAHNEIEKAWLVLKTPARRRQYDRNETAGRLPIGVNLKLNDTRLLFACVVLLVGVLSLVWIPLYGSRLRSFSPGDALFDLGGRPFGTVVRVEERHQFPTGAATEAYLVDVSTSRELRWYPAADIRATCRKSPS